MNRKRLAVAGLGVLVATGALTACNADKYVEPFRDAPRTNYSDTGAAEVVEMPDGFSNAATKCLHNDKGQLTGLRITTAYHGDNKYAAVSVVADPTCK